MAAWKAMLVTAKKTTGNPETRRGTDLAGALLLASLASLSKFALAAQPAGAAEPEPANSTVLHVRPAAEPQPALKYRLLPLPAIQRAGNAAPIYGKAVALLGSIGADERKKIDAWLEAPLADLPRDEIHKLLEQRSMALDCLHIAARRAKCEWDPPIDEWADFWSIPLPEIQELQTGSRLLALQARLEIAAGKIDAAIDTLATGFAMSRHLADCPFLVSALVGQAMATRMLAQLETLLQTAQAPNLYWSLTALPAPLCDFRPALDLESASILKSVHLGDVDSAPRSEAGWRSLLMATLEALYNVERLEIAEKAAADKPDSSPDERLAKALAAAPTARAGLILAGRDQEQVAKMSDAEAVIVYTQFDYCRRRDSRYKWLALPYWQAGPALRASLESEVNKRPEIIPLATLTLPAIEAVLARSAQLNQRIAALRAIEALRLHAAAHEGKLPKSLADIAEAPLPVDPATGTMFRYTLADDANSSRQRATLAGESIIVRGKQSPLEYELRIEPMKRQ